MTLPRSGDILHITKDASVQFTTPMRFRVIRVLDWPTYEGWVWINGYQLDQHGDAVERRTIFVQTAGLKQVGKTTDARSRPVKAQRGTTKHDSYLPEVAIPKARTGRVTL